MMKKLLSIFLLASLSLLVACSNDDNDNNPNPEFYLNATIGSESKTWESDNGGLTRISIGARIDDLGTSKQTSISAQNVEGLEVLQIMINAEVEAGKSYQATSSVLGGTPSLVLCNYTKGTVAYTTASIITNTSEHIGSVTINEKTDSYIAGTFEFRVLAGTGDELEITNGEFKAQLNF